MKPLLLVVAVAIAPLAARAADAWEVVVDPAATREFEPDYLWRAPTGDYEMAESGGLAYSELEGFDLAAHRVAFDHVVSEPANAASGSWYARTSVLPSPYEGYPHLVRPCRLERDLLGADNRTIGFDVDAAYDDLLHLGLASGDEANLVAIETTRGAPRVVRYRDDCSSELLAPVDGTPRAAVAVHGLDDALVAYQAAADQSPRIARVGADGVRWDRSLSNGGGDVLLPRRVASFRDGDYAVLAQRDNAVRVTRFNATGDERWSHALPRYPAAFAPFGQLTLAVVRESDLLGRPVDTLFVLLPNGRTLRHALDGRHVQGVATREVQPHDFAKTSPPIAISLALVTAEPEPPYVQTPYLLHDTGQLQALPSLQANESIVAQVSAEEVLVRRGNEFRVRRADLDSALELALPRVGADVSTLRVAADADGVAFLHAFEDESAQLSWFDHDGTLRWRSALRERVRFELLAIGRDRLCGAYVDVLRSPWSVGVQCLAKADGTVVLPPTVLSGGNGRLEGMTITDDGRVRVVQERGCTGACLVAVDFIELVPGSQPRVVTKVDASGAVFDAASGAFAWQAFEPAANFIESWLPDGTLRWREPMARESGGGLLAVAPEGAVLAMTRDSEDFAIRQFSGGSGADWTHATAGWCDSPTATPLAGGDWLLWGRLGEIDRYGLGPTCDALRVQRIEAATGRIRWSHARPMPIDTRRFELHVDAARGGFVIVTERGEGNAREHRAVRHSLADGRLLGAERVARSVGGQGATALAPDGAIVGAQWSREGAGHSRIALFTSSNALAQPPASPRMRALRGAWSQRDTPGQGFFLDWLAATDTVYGGWFTYAAGGTHDVEAQRWYLLVGRDGDDEAVLSIEEVTGGRFLAPNVAASRTVGEASLRLVDCDHASLVYRFSDGEHAGRQGAIALDRASSASVACGSTEGPSARSRQGGAWSIEGFPGQGIVLDRRDDAGGQSAFLSGAWFTHTAATAGEDLASGTQRWFTLTGQVPNAADSVTVEIFRALGGALDGEGSNNRWSIGQATISFLACDRATLDYRFDDDDELAHGFAGRSGRLSLRRTGGCPP